MDLDIDVAGRGDGNNYIPGNMFFKENKFSTNTWYVEAPNGQVIIKNANDKYEAASPTQANLAKALKGSTLHNKTIIGQLFVDANNNNQADQNEWLIVDNPNATFQNYNGTPKKGYDLQTVRTLISSFLNANVGGSTVTKVLFNDPRTWDLDTNRVKFTPNHNGHIHLDIKAPSAALTPNNFSQKNINFFPTSTDISSVISTPNPLVSLSNLTLLNDSISNAIDLGKIEDNLTLNGNISNTNPEIYYRFTLGNPVNENQIEGLYFNTLRDFSLVLNGLSADVDTELIEDFNEDGIRQDDEVIANSSQPVNNDETINITDINEGIYYIRIFQKSGDTNYNLSLTVPPLPVPPDNAGNTLSNAQNLGTLSANLTRTDFIGEVDPDDYYRFSLAALSDLSLEVNGLDQGDLIATLGQDTNNDGVIDFDETIAISDAEGNDPEAIDINGLATGTYYVWLSRSSGNTNYNLNLSATPAVIPPDQAGSTPSTAFDIGSLSSASNFSDFVGNVDPEDYYRFSLANVSGLRIQLDGLSADADLELAQDTNNDGVIDSDEIISTSDLSGTDAEVIDISALAAGTYFVRVHQYEGDTNYNLSLTPTNPVGSDLSVKRTDATGAVDLGQQYTYTLTVTNNGPSTANNVILRENLPSGVNVTSNNSVSVSNGVVTANLGTLNSGKSVTVNLTLSTFISGELLSTANVTGDEFDYNLSNNSLVSTKTVNSITSPDADLELTQTVNNSNPRIGDQVTFTLTLTNKGPGTATVIKVKDILPGALSYVSAVADLGSYDSNTGIWTVGNMPPNQSVKLGITATVNSGQLLTNTAQVIAVDEGDPDSTPNNNNPNEDDQASVIVTIGTDETPGNLAPTDLTLSATTVNENVAPNTVIGTFSSTDPDTGNSFTYSLIAGTGDTDNTAFSIVGNQLQINNSPDF
ncbi:MAG: DUF11 domain-containing protein, partial [Microcystis sp. M040S2]